MLFVPEGAEGGLEVLLAVLLLPPAIPPILQKSAKVSFPECCQFSCSSVGNATTMQCNHNGQTGKPPSRLAPPSLHSSCFPFPSFPDGRQSSLPDHSPNLPDGQHASLFFRVILFLRVARLVLYQGTIAHSSTGGSGNISH